MEQEQVAAERPSGAERPQESGAAALGRGGRMSRRRKRDAVLRLLRGEDLETVSRSLGVTAATLSGWREAFLTAGEASLSARPTDGEALESGRLKARLGEMLLERELLEAKIAQLEARPGPLARRTHKR
jgi:transposase